MFKLIRKVVSLILVVVVIIPTYALFVTWNSAKNPTFRTSAEVIVVPGAAQLNGTPGEVLLGRLEQAKKIFEAGYAPLIITVGSGAPGDRTTEAASGKYWLRTHGIPAKKIVSLPFGRDTLTQSQAYIKEMKSRKIYNVIITTDAYHCQRAMTMANDLGATATCSPATTGPNTLEKSRSRYLIREAGAYLAYITLGRRGIHLSDHLTNSGLVRYAHDFI
ncbi:MAG: YdcF family protein [Actinobacteria bacterium]|nr:YdcF family protein [Actinomycetota bacterium]